YADMGGDVVPSNQIRVDVTTGPVPTAPLNFSGTVNGSLVNLTWSPPANAGVAPVQTYVIEAGSQPGLSDIANFLTGTPTPGYAAVVPNGNYYVRVRASCASGLGPPTPDVRIIVGPPPPGAPTLSGGATGPGGVVLTWTAAPAPGAPVTGYQLHAGSGPGLSNIAVLPLQQLGYAAADVPPGTYYVRVVGLSSQGPGEPSNELVVVIP
ncbi:MAG TPA: fibronectin type III domain-containing protein, partial [Longimicrobium sp.]|nr:fibronectin type III domain-containing protein [Longimicrobium sp.]